MPIGNMRSTWQSLSTLAYHEPCYQKAFMVMQNLQLAYFKTSSGHLLPLQLGKIQLLQVLAQICSSHLRFFFLFSQ